MQHYNFAQVKLATKDGILANVVLKTYFIPIFECVEHFYALEYHAVSLATC